MIQATKKYDVSFKVVLLGDSGVGKTSLITSYINRTFKENEASTVGAAYFTKIIDFEASKIQLEIWDTAGQERFHTIAPVYYRKASGILLVYDITNRHSLERVKDWITEIESIGNPHCHIFLIGNKIDLEINREINLDDALLMAKKHNLEHFEVTAKDPEQIDIIMREMTKKLMTRFVSVSKDGDVLLKGEKSISNNESYDKPARKCCQQ